MKVIFFICFSLLASLFHVATMPIHTMGDSSMSAKIEITGHHTMHQHHKMMESGHHQADHHQSEDHCPSYNGSCCLTLNIPLNHLDSIQLSSSEDVYPPTSFAPSKLVLETLYRPPKFFA